MECSKCSRPTEGWKCTDCAAVSEKHDADHACGGDKCVPKCKACNEAQDKCTC